MMSQQHNAICTICGKTYRLCRSCMQKAAVTPWRTVTDSLEHYKIYLAIHGYTLSKNKTAARQELANCDLSGFENFNPEITSVIKEIMKEQTNE